jgi:RimJ/RimL family protein N-acetyltransferase
MLSTLTDFPMPIVTPRLVLRPPTLSHNDIQEYFNAVTESMNEISQWLPWARYYPTFVQAEDYIRTCESCWITKNDNNIGLPLWIMDKANKKFIGNIASWNINWDIPKFEFGYWLRTSQTKKGYITEAVNALTRYCFLQLGIRRIEIRCERENTRAQQVPKRLGFKLEGILRNSTIAVSNGKLTDTFVFSRIDLERLPDLEVVWGKK